MTSRLKLIITGFCSLLVFFSGCKNPETKSNLQTGKVQINLKTTVGTKDTTESYSKSFVFVTIRDQTGEKILSNLKVQLLREGFWFASIPISLPVGSYLIDPVVFWDEAKSLLLEFSTTSEFVIRPNQLITLKSERASVVRPSLSDSLEAILDEKPDVAFFQLSVKAMNHQADSLFFVDGTLLKSIDGTPVSLTFLTREPQKILLSRDSKTKTVSFAIKSPHFLDTTVVFNFADFEVAGNQSCEIQLEPINPIKKQLVAWYTFDGNTKDMSGNNYHGKENQVVYVNDRFGADEKAAIFQKNSRIFFGDVFNEVDIPFSISFWIKTTHFKPLDINSLEQFMTNAFLVFGSDYFQTETVYAGFRINYYNGLISLDLMDGAGYGYQYRKTVFSDKLIGDGKWHMVTGVAKTFKDMKIFIDSSPSTQPYLNERKNGKAIHLQHSNPPAVIGFSMQAEIDDFRLYNYALSPAQIDSLYHEGGWK